MRAWDGGVASVASRVRLVLGWGLVSALGLVLAVACRRCSLPCIWSRVWLWVLSWSGPWVWSGRFVLVRVWGLALALEAKYVLNEIVFTKKNENVFKTKNTNKIKTFVFVNTKRNVIGN